jgi:hypothetical protein
MVAGDFFPGFQQALLGILGAGEKNGYHHAHPKEAAENAALFGFPPRNVDDIVAAVAKGEVVA